MKSSILHAILVCLLPAMAGCGGGESGGGEWSGRGKKDGEEYLLPVRVVVPTRSDVEDYVETQANLESAVLVTVLAETEGRILKRVVDVGAEIGATGKPPFLLAEMDQRDHVLALKDAEIHLLETAGRARELTLELQRNTRLLDQANQTSAEALAVFNRMEAGKQDGTISLEEHEAAKFALNRSKTAVLIADSAVAKSNVGLELNKIAVQKAEVARDRALLSKERTRIVTDLRGTVTICNIRDGEWVRTGQELYRIEDTSQLVVYGDIPVRQAARVKVGNVVRIGSTATPAGTSGSVILVEPTVNSASGTVRVKIKVTPRAGFKPGLFVSLRIVVEQRAQALVVPKRAVLHHDQDGTYLFTVKDGKASRILVKTGFEREDVIEIIEGIDDNSQVVVEGQDTLTDSAKVDTDTAS